MPETKSQTHRIAGRREWIGLGVLALPCLLLALGGAVEIGRRLGGQPGTELVRTARDAFAQSMELVAALGALLVMTMAVVAVVLLRNVRRASESAGDSLPAAA